MCYTGGISPIRGGGIASVILNVVDETEDEINYTLVTSFDEIDLHEALSIYDATVRIVSLRSWNNALLNSIMYALNAPTSGFDIVHFHNLPMGRSLIYALKLHFKGVGLVFSHHFRRESTKYFPFNHRSGAEYYRLSFNYLSKIWRRIIVNSKFMLRDLKRYGDCVSKAAVIPNGVNIEKIQKSQPISLAGDPSFLFIGHLQWHKGVDILLRAFNLLLKKKSFGKAHLHLVGSGRMKPHYKDFVRRKKISNRVHFWGSLPQNLVFRLLKGCDIFVLPSRSEGSPIVLLEAMAAEKPIISTNVGGIPEILAHNRNALMIQPKETELVRAMEYLMENEDLMRAFSKNNRKDIVPFSWRNVCEKYVNLYESIANL